MTGLVTVTKERQMATGTISWHEYSFDGVDGNGAPYSCGPFPGVTTIIGKLAKYLESYHIGLGIKAALAELDELAANLERDGEASTVKELTVVAQQSGNKQRETGSRVHAAIEALLRGQAWEHLLEKGEKAYVDNFQRDFLDAYKPTIKNVEYAVISPTHEYGGTADLFAEINGEPWLLDTKTGSGVYGETGMQLVALANADFAGRPGDPQMYPVPEPVNYGVLHVRPRSTKLKPARVTGDEWMAFLALRVAARWVRERQRKVFEAA